MTLHFTVPGKVQPWQRARTNRGRYYPDPETAAYEELIAFTARAVMVGKAGFPLEGAVSVRFIAYIERPKTVKNRRHPHVKPDLDNIEKALLDGLTQAGVWKDDAQVCEKTGSKYYGKACLVVWIDPLD